MKIKPQLFFWLLLLITAAVSIYSFPKHAYIGDPYWMRAQAQAWIDGRDDIPAQYASKLEVGQYCFYNEASGKYYSKYGLFNSVFMLPMALLWKWCGGESFYVGEVRSAKFVLMLNCFNLAWTLGLAAALYWGASLFCKRSETAALWTLISMFAGFGWNYLRAQSGEIFQWTAASVFFAAAVSLLRSQNVRQEVSPWVKAALWLSLISLVMLKSIYILILPIWLVIWYWPQCRAENMAAAAESELSVANNREKGLSWRDRLRHSAWQIGPTILVAVLLLVTNYWRFGSPFNTGYTQWSREAQAFSGNLWQGIGGFLFSSDKSIFLYQPLLIFALISAKDFYKRFRKESLLVGTIFLVFLLVNSKFINWGGHWGYGPRYLLFVLSQLSWPTLLLFEYIIDNWSVWKSKILALVVAVAVCASFYLQIETNSLEFFTYYRVEAALQAYPAPQALAMFKGRPFGLVNRDLMRLYENNIYPDWLLEACREVPDEAEYLPQLMAKFCIYN
ncbi:MAG: hypothetical protein ACI38Q_03995 [Candidatus Bruticola sp.]